MASFFICCPMQATAQFAARSELCYLSKFIHLSKYKLPTPDAGKHD